jgi:hypothetical protein
MNKKSILFLILISTILAGCNYQSDPRSLASTEISITFDGERCLPYESFVPIGQEIELTLINNSQNGLSWYLIFLPFSGDFEDQDPENILATANSPANKTTTTKIKAPYLPGKYSSFCVVDNDFDDLALSYLLVVEPYK